MTAHSYATNLRSIILLAKIITFLFLTCLSAPDVAFLCDNKKLDVGSAFIDDALDSFSDIKVSKDGWFMAILTWIGGIFFRILLNAMWVLPVTILVWFDLTLTDLLHETDNLHEQRLLELHHGEQQPLLHQHTL